MRFILSVLFLFSTFLLKADEGMWLVNLLREQSMQKMHSMGCKLSLEQIYSETKPSLKDAIISLDNGACTASVISSDALIITNYHCAMADVQSLSTLENNYLRDGYSSKEEIHIPGKTATFLIKIVDVTNQMKGLQDSLSLRKSKHVIIAENSRHTNYELDVKYMNTNDKYFLFYYQTYRDIRLVVAPASSIGNFGGDRDNFTWPQHKCDFAIYRIYGDSLSQPAPFSEKNIPIKPKYFIPLAKKKPKEGDFTLCLGYPYETKRYLSSFELENIYTENELFLSVAKCKIDVLKKEIAKSEAAKLKYSSMLFDVSNVYKKKLGENTFIKRLNLIDKKELLEKDFNSLSNIEACCDSLLKYKNAFLLSKECLAKGSELISFAFSLKALNSNLSKAVLNKSYINRYKIKCRQFYNNTNFNIDKIVCSVVLEKYFAFVDKVFIPPYLLSLFLRFDKNIDKLVSFLYSNTLIIDKSSLSNIIEKSRYKILEKDPLYCLSLSIFKINKRVRKKIIFFEKQLQLLQKEYMLQINSLNKNMDLSPDANSSMRLSYGRIESFSPVDVVHCNAFSSFLGLKKKYKLNIKDYSIPDHLVFPLFSNKLSVLIKTLFLKTSFITNNDIISGSSGSPILNANGELVGLAYDGNWESMAGDFFYHKRYNRAVCVDVSYVSYYLQQFCPFIKIRLN